MRVPEQFQRSILCGLALAVSCAPLGVGQRKGGGTVATPSAPPTNNFPSGANPAGVQRGGYPLNDSPLDLEARLVLEDRRSKMQNIERQHMMEKEATQLARLAAELQQSVDRGEPAAERDESLRRADAIEKLAHNVRERMKGAR